MQSKDGKNFKNLKIQICSILTKGSTCRKKKYNEIFVDLNRASHDTSVEKKQRSNTNIYEVMFDLRTT